MLLLARILVIVGSLLLVMALYPPFPAPVFLQAALLILALYAYVTSFTSTLSYWESTRSELAGSFA